MGWVKIAVAAAEQLYKGSDRGEEKKAYDLHFRIVRFQISGGYYETVYTNLDAQTFPIEKIKELYRLRWGIETLNMPLD